MDEVKDKSEKDIDLSSWEQEYVEDLPEQKNGCVYFLFFFFSFFFFFFSVALQNHFTKEIGRAHV